MCDEEETVQRSTEYLQGVQDCAEFVIDQLISELGWENAGNSSTVKTVDRILEVAKEQLQNRFMKDLGADHDFSKPKAKGVVSEKPAPTEA